MGKSEKTGLGRALVKHHNQMIQESKDKGRFYRNQQKKVLESITDVTDIDAVIEQADEAARLFSADNPIPNLLVDSYVVFRLLILYYILHGSLFYDQFDELFLPFVSL